LILFPGFPKKLAEPNDRWLRRLNGKQVNGDESPHEVFFLGLPQEAFEGHLLLAELKNCWRPIEALLQWSIETSFQMDDRLPRIRVNDNE